ncbi:rRNA methyltransferase [Tessaracoccus lapidicaptus]|uniref:rRNA methyltransferase n=1 Tax=Tessaracoccus lapidicaptus TaxID=1427523 RepID=A0A1C0AGK5_9ACTN|nr:MULTISPECIES: RNA methyltransferase [Tessaracoccus]AQX14934.1 rRNA methyltransferase [Tessaracoccus sp. T2.5-30]OCL30840.1 rRNA methyltransferase [Tessaracoccus lapidicaptus]VEP39098.1 tRNA (guanosine(18)-2'-O)-methyltransferase [Tessaracoccus lapidicaptus]
MTTEPDAAPGLPASVLRSVRRLTQRRGRDVTRQFLVEGRQAVREALAGADIVEQVIVDDPAKHADLLAGVSVPVWQADEHQMRQLSDTVTPQGILAVCRQLAFGWEALDGARLVVICAQVRDPGNAGTVIRCADAFGADAVILTAGSVEIYNPKTVRSTVGSLFHMPILTGVPLAEAVARVKAMGMRVLAADGEGAPLDLKAAAGELNGPIAWIMGNEAWGLPAEDARLADEVVAVPMWGQAESLNLSSAAAVCLYATASAQRRNL